MFQFEVECTEAADQNQWRLQNPAELQEWGYTGISLEGQLRAFLQTRVCLNRRRLPECSEAVRLGQGRTVRRF